VERVLPKIPESLMHLWAERERCRELLKAAIKSGVLVPKEWKAELQSLTPGGSEFTEPKECGDYLRKMKSEKHEAMKRLAKKPRVSVERLTTLLEKVWDRHDGCVLGPDDYKEFPEPCCYLNAAKEILADLTAGDE
jgi:hypothetical protein